MIYDLTYISDSLAPTRVIEGVVQPVSPTTAEQRLARKNELKARGTLLMALPDKHQLKFNIHKDAMTLMEAIEKRFGGNKETKKVQKTLLKQQYENFTCLSSESLDQIHDRLQKLISQFEDQSLDDLFNSLKIYEAEVKSSSSSSTSKQNIAFVSSQTTDSTNDPVNVVASVSATSAKIHVSALPNVDTLSNAVIYSFFASQSNSPQLDNDDLKQIDADDLEEIDLKWQLAMLTMRARQFLRRTRRNLEANGPTSMRFDMSKVECYNCHMKGYFAKECRSLKDTKRNGAAKPQRRNVPVETSTSNALVSQCDGDGYHAVPPPYTGTFMPPKPDLIFHNAPNRIEQVKTPMPSVKTVETSIPTANPKIVIPKPKNNGNCRNRKACFVCKSLDHLIKDCDFYEKKMAHTTVRNHAQRGNHQQYAIMTLLNPQKHVIPIAVLTKSKHVPITAARPVTAVVLKHLVTRPSQAKTVVTKPHSPPRRNFNRSSSPKASKFPPKVTAVKVPQGNPQHALQNKGIIDSGCSRHMIGNMSYLSDFEELNGGYVAFGGNSKGGKISGKDENQVLLRVPRENNMYNVDLKNIVPSGDLTCLFAKATLDESNLWHRRLGYINFKTINKLVKGNLVRGLPTKVFKNNYTCVACKKGKQHRASCKTKLTSSVSQPLQRLHIDLFGPTFVKSLNKKSYCLVVMDDYSRFTWVFFLATKDETSPILKTFITSIENQICLKVKIIRSDNRTKLKNNDLNQFCGIKGIKGIKKEFSVPRTPQQNGIVERKNRTLIEAAKTMLADSLLPIPFWTEAVNTACYVQNRVLVTKPQNKTLYELLLGRSPSIGSGPTWLFDIDSLTNTMNYQPVTAGNQTNPSAGVQEQFDVEKAGKECVPQYVFFPVWSFGSTNPQNTNDDAAFGGKKPDFEGRKPKSEVHVSPSSKFEDFSNNIINEVNTADSLVPVVGQILTNSTNTFSAAGPSNTIVSPTNRKSSYVNTSQYPDDPNMPELEDITYSDDEEDVGAEADFPNFETTITVSPIPTTRVHKYHHVTQIIGGASSILDAEVRNKARLVAQGHTQEEGIDYEEFFAPVARIKAIRLFLAYASFMGFMVYQIDVKSAFMYETIEEEVYVCQPPEFKDPDYPDKIYVDDIIFGYTNKDLCKAFKKLMKDKFQMSSMGELTFFLGLQVKQKQDEIFIRQDKYVAEILRKFGLIDGKSSSTLIDTEKPLLKDPDGEDVDVHTYRSMIVKRIFSYLKGKPHLGLWYPKDSPFNLVSYSDSDYAGASLDRKSTIGGCQFLGCGLIFWQCKKQTVVATSSTEAEYVATASCCVNDVTRLQALVDKKKVIIIEATIRYALQLNDAEGIDCLPNEEIFAELSRMGYEKAFTKLTFYKAFFSPQWKFLIHTILQCMSVKRTSWNEFSSFMALAVICLSTGNGFSGVDTPLFEGIIVAQQVDEGVAEVNVDDVPATGVADKDAADFHDDVVPTAVDEPSIPLPPPPPSQDVPSTLQVQPTPPPSLIIQPLALQQQTQPTPPPSLIILYNLLDTCTTLTRRRNKLKVSKLRRLKKVGATQRVDTSDDTVIDDVSKQGRIIADMDADVDVTLKEVVVDAEIKEKPAELQEVVEVVTTAKLITEVVTAASATITVAAPTLTTAAALTFTTAPSIARRRKGVVIRDPEETATPSTIIHTEAKSKDKGKGILVEEPKPLKKQAQIKQDEAFTRELEAELNKTINWDDVIDQVQRNDKEDNVVMRYQALKRKPQTEAQARKNIKIYLRNMAGFKMDYFKRMKYDDIRPIFEKYFNYNVAFLEKTREQMEKEDNKALKRISESQEEKAAKKQKLNEEDVGVRLLFVIVVDDTSSSAFQRYFNLCTMDTIVLSRPASLSAEVSNSITNIELVFKDLSSCWDKVTSQSFGAGCEPFGVANTEFLLETRDNIDFRPMESPSKKNRLSTPRARNRRLPKFTNATSQCRSSGHVGGVSYEHTDLGDCDQQCHHCGAAFWFASNTLGAIVFDSRLTGSTEFDVIIEQRGEPPKRINKLHFSLQFPLLFIRGQSGFHNELKLRRADGGGRLFQQYVVGVLCCIEQNRLDFIRKKKNDIRSDYWSGLYDDISRGEQDGFEVGGRIILPMSFTGAIYAHYLDVLAICRKLVEFQKRGLPHCHTLLCVDSSSKIQEPEYVDRVILAELPDLQNDPHGYKVVSEMMIHGPCGAVNISATFENPDYPDKVYKVVKVLYRLHQAPRAWYETLANYLLENGFQRGKIDQTLFIKKQKGDILLVQVYVDDIIFGSTNKDLCKAFEKLMKDKFQMSSIGELTFFFGLQVKQKQNGIFISKDKYVAKILRKFSLTDGKSAIDTEKHLLEDPDAYSDSDYAGASLDRKSTTGGCQYLGCRLIFCAMDSESIAGLWKKVIITEATIREALRLDDAKSIDCLPNEEIFTELSRMGYEKPSTKLTFYKAFSLPQWKAQVGDLSSHTTKYSSPALTQKVFANMRRVGNGFFRVETPLFEGMIVAQQADDVADKGVAGIDINVVPAAAVEPSIPSPTPTSQPLPPSQELPSTSQDKIAQTLEITKLKQRVKKLERRNKLKVSKLRRLRKIIANMDADEDVTLKEVTAVAKEVEVEKDDDELEPVELQEVVEVVTIAKLMTKVVTAASATITVATTPITAAILIATPNKGKGIMVEEPKPLKKQAQIEQDEAYARELEAELNKNINWDDVIEQVQRKEKEDNVMEDEDSRALKRASKSQAKKAAKKQKLDEEVEELKKHLQIVPNDEDDVYTEATPLARKVPIVDYEIYTQNNKPYYKIIRADESS
uniref:Putative ribonuclease H-like domain-containing protein n=1 Tax=Tanacetum cinerariifolium TaxID=118510 RepID=A0A6L2L876_TANCI|nr:putative ribonuclease H-like domain-containing protein [Tanacetum cinerariifolium]